MIPYWHGQSCTTSQKCWLEAYTRMQNWIDARKLFHPMYSIIVFNENVTPVEHSGYQRSLSYSGNKTWLYTYDYDELRYDYRSIVIIVWKYTRSTFANMFTTRLDNRLRNFIGVIWASWRLQSFQCILNSVHSLPKQALSIHPYIHQLIPPKETSNVFSVVFRVVMLRYRECCNFPIKLIGCLTWTVFAIPGIQ